MKSKLEKIAIFIHWSMHLLGIATIVISFPLFYDYPFKNIFDVWFITVVIFAVCYFVYSAIGGFIRFLLTGKFLLFPWKKHGFEKPVIWTICISVIYVAILYFAIGEL
tara:strand:+ start:434 stop:757 length:324 start_codon:yes stop_codon:yes gene_type:complete